MSLTIPVVLGSVREGRKSYFPALLMAERLKAAGVISQLVDFKGLPLPFVDCPKEPAQYEKRYPNENVQRWSEIADAADGFVFITPEYNHGYSGVLKNALDWLYPEFKRKAAGLVGVSSGAVGGARAIEQLRPILADFSMFCIRETVMFAKVGNVFDEQGILLDPAYNKKIDGFVSSLLWLTEALKKAR